MSKPEIKTLYRCGQCREVHDDEDGARECCIPEIIEVYACPICGVIHDEEEDAGKCCGFDIARCPSCHREYGAATSTTPPLLSPVTATPATRSSRSTRRLPLKTYAGRRLGGQKG